MGLLERVLDGVVVDPPPVWMMRQAGRYLPEYRELRARVGGFIELCLDPKSAVAATLQPVQRFQLDAAILFSDILIVPLALGVKLWFEEGEGPRLEPVVDRNGFSRMGDRLARGVVGPVYEATGQARAELQRDTALIGFCGGPWTVATYLVAGRGSEDKREALTLAASDPGLFAEIIGRLAEASAAHLVGQLRAGADVVQIFDTWAGALDEEGFERWCLAPTRSIVTRVRAEIPDARVILFPKGVSLPRLERIVSACAPNAISLEAAANRKQACAVLGPSTALQGNLDPEILLAGGEMLDREVDAIRDDFRGTRHIFNLGHGILKDTPIAHVERMLARVRAS
jgi:uroporphyrinogen decarboxylase